MANYMKTVASKWPEFTPEDRNLLSLAFKNVIGNRRASWRVLSSFELKETESNGKNEFRLLKIKEYKLKIENEMRQICGEILQILDEHLIPVSSNIDASRSDVDQRLLLESKVFYWKLKGDYYRYLAEFAKEDHDEVTQKSMSSYQQAYELAANLPVTHPVRLGLALNFSVFYYETVNQPGKASELAKKSFDDAIHELEALSEEESRESRLILRFIRDNLAIWNPEGEMHQ